MWKVKRASDGRANLHIWREGEEYHRQKSSIFLKEFTNLMFSPLPQSPDPAVIFHDVTKPLRFPRNTFDAINVYHVFEHLTLKEGQRFAVELHRVLKAGGTCRISVPDLEMIVREYLEHLEKSLVDPSEQNLKRYRWSVMELIDQATRERSGGLMLEALRQSDVDVTYVLRRYSDVFRPILEPHVEPEASRRVLGPSTRLIDRLKPLTWDHLFTKALRFIPAKISQYRRRRKRRQLKGDPRKTKEAVRWMHDRVSLRLLVEGAGFVNFKVQAFNRSDISGWEGYNLDQSNYGEYPIDPSIYVECRKRS